MTLRLSSFSSILIIKVGILSLLINLTFSKAYAQENYAELGGYGACLSVQSFLALRNPVRLDRPKLALFDEVTSLVEATINQTPKSETDCDVVARLIVDGLIATSIIQSDEEAAAILADKNQRELILKARKTYCGDPKYLESEHRLFCATIDYESYLAFMSELNKSKGISLPNDLFSTTSPARSEAQNFSQTSSDFGQCKTVAENTGGAAELRACVYREIERNDVILNSAYQCLKANLSKSEFKPYLTAQRKWGDETKRACAFEDTQGTIAHDLRAGCRLSAFQEATSRILEAAVQNNCPYIDIDNIEPDRDKWLNVDGNPSVSNQDGFRLELQCDGSGNGVLSAIAQGTFPALSEREPLNFEIFNGSGDVVAIIGLRGALTENGYNFPVTEYVLSQLRSGSRLNVTDRTHNLSFSLRGSSRAIEACDVTSRVNATSTSNSSNLLPPATATPKSTWQTAPEQLGTYVTINPSMPLQIRCDTAFPELYSFSPSKFTEAFGREPQEGDAFAVETYDRGGKSLESTPVSVERLSAGVGMRLSLQDLNTMARRTNMALVGLGHEYIVSLSPEREKLEYCQQVNFAALRRYLIGEWEWAGIGGDKLIFTTEPVATVAGVHNRLIHIDSQGNEFRDRFHWYLFDSGQLNVNINSHMCRIKHYDDGLQFESGFNCIMQGTWLRR